LKKLFWRIVLPFFLAILAALARAAHQFGLARRFEGFSGGGIEGEWNPKEHCESLRHALQWGREAEAYQSHLKEAEQIEKERRRRASWTER